MKNWEAWSCFFWLGKPLDGFWGEKLLEWRGSFWDIFWVFWCCGLLMYERRWLRPKSFVKMLEQSRVFCGFLSYCLAVQIWEVLGVAVECVNFVAGSKLQLSLVLTIKFLQAAHPHLLHATTIGMCLGSGIHWMLKAAVLEASIYHPPTHPTRPPCRSWWSSQDFPNGTWPAASCSCFCIGGCLGVS